MDREEIGREEGRERLIGIEKDRKTDGEKETQFGYKIDGKRER